MTLLHILIFALASLPFMWLVPSTWRPWGLLAGSLLAVIWLMTDGVFTRADVLLITFTLLLVLAVWWVGQGGQVSSEDRVALLVIGGALCLTASAALWFGPAQLAFVLTGGALLAVSSFSLSRFMIQAQMRGFAVALIALIIVVLLILKTPPLAALFGGTAGSPAIVTTASPLVWLGFSYVAFRLIAVLLDYQAGNLPKGGFPLRDMATYVLFFPAFTAGPIDRAQRFIPEVQQAKALDASRLVEGIGRIAVGAFKKFVIADSLALVSMNPVLTEQTQSTAGLWVLVYLYAFQIFFDFSGYSDVAIGLGRLYGITLPENFDRPYMQRNLQLFWQRWHMTLSTWFRVYYFTPLSRAMLRSRLKLPQWGMVFIAQVSTMILIGLWHGVTLNFLLWGLWHGLGLYALKLLVDNTRGWYKRISTRAWPKRLLTGVSVLATFHYVALGWVFFALPDVQSSLTILQRLFGG
ncbi:MAG: hypothetical protein OHK0046_39350 [Anaerolineae bacterium]